MKRQEREKKAEKRGYTSERFCILRRAVRPPDIFYLTVHTTQRKGRRADYIKLQHHSIYLVLLLSTFLDTRYSLCIRK